MWILDKLKNLFGGASSNGGASTNGAGGGMGDMANMMSCEEALRLVHEYLDGELDVTSGSEVKKHFDMCERCYPHLRLESVYREAVRRAVRGEAAPDALRARVAALIAEVDPES